MRGFAVVEAALFSHITVARRGVFFIFKARIYSHCKSTFKKIPNYPIIWFFGGSEA